MKRFRRSRQHFIAAAAVLLCALLLLDIAYYCFMVNVAILAKKNPSTTAFIAFREHQWKKSGKAVHARRYWVGLSQIAPCMRHAVVVAEDAKFWKHDGFDFEAIQKAIEKDIRERKFKIGASTISQQVAKNLFLSPVKSPLRKCNEAILTWRLEKDLSKKRILELYLNIAEWGEGIFGIEAASRAYFNKSAGRLGPEEAARLAAVLPNPIKYSPLGSSRFVDRRSTLIERMIAKSGIIAAAIEQAVKDSMGGPTENAAGTDTETAISSLNSAIDSAESIQSDSGALRAHLPLSVDSTQLPAKTSD